MKNFILVLALIITNSSISQNKQNIVIAKKFPFQSSENSYNLNFMFKGILQSAFNVYFEGEELPKELATNRCNFFTGLLLENNNMFTTKLKFQIIDCQNNVVFESIEVKSREKDIQLAYTENMKMLSQEVRKYYATKKTQLVEKNNEPTTTSTTTQENTTEKKHSLLEINNGFAILENKAKVVLQIYKTNNATIFIGDKFGVKGVFTIIENKGIFEYYENDKLITEEYWW